MEGTETMNPTLVLHSKRLWRSALALLSLLLVPLLPVPAYGGDDPSVQPDAILAKYVQAIQSHDISPRGASMEVDIAVSVPRLKEEGKLRALRKISKVGQITYRVLAFQGNNTVKTQVIGRFLQAEQQGQGDQSLAITPTNYKFKYKGERQKDPNKDTYVFQVSPRTKKVGLFKGEIWLDANTCLPVFEKGRLVKNPSIFFKKVDFERSFRIQDGMVLPENMVSTIDTRVIGKVELNINYSNFTQTAGETESEDGIAQASSTPPTTAR